MVVFSYFLHMSNEFRERLISFSIWRDSLWFFMYSINIITSQIKILRHSSSSDIFQLEFSIEFDLVLDEKFALMKEPEEDLVVWVSIESPSSSLWMSSTLRRRGHTLFLMSSVTRPYFVTHSYFNLIISIFNVNTSNECKFTLSWLNKFDNLVSLALFSSSSIMIASFSRVEFILSNFLC